MKKQAMEHLNTIINEMRMDGYSVRVLAESDEHIRIDTPRGEIIACLNPLLGKEDVNLDGIPYCIVYMEFRTGYKYLGNSPEDVVDMIRGTYERRRV